MNQNVDWEQRIDWNAVRDHRLNRIVTEMKVAGYDALMFTKLDALRYAISFRSVFSLWFHGNRYILLITADGKVKFLVASGCLERVLQTMPWVNDPEPLPFVISQGLKTLTGAIDNLGLSGARIGVDMMPFSLYDPLKAALPKASFVDGSIVIEKARRKKHPDEVKALRLAAEIVDIGMDTVMQNVKPGITEHEISSAASYAMNLAGSEETPYMPLVCAGEHGSIGYRFPTDRRLKHGEMVYSDCGAAVLNGYNGDIARTTVVGKAKSEEQKKIYRAMVQMLEAGTKAVRPGASTSEIAFACQNAAAEAGYGKYTYYGIVGHGIGTDIHEAPSIGEKVCEGEEVERLMTNEVICLEPGILVPGVGGGHVENMILVTDQGSESLTQTPFDEKLL
jgi:Xaa-Pro aminopeptidase